MNTSHILLKAFLIYWHQLFHQMLTMKVTIYYSWSPLIHETDAPQRESVSVSFIDHSALPSLQQEKTPLIVVLCTSGIDTSNCLTVI